MKHFSSGVLVCSVQCAWIGRLTDCADCGTWHHHHVPQEKSIMTRGQNFDFTRGHQWRFFYILSNKIESDEKCVLPELFGDFWEKNEKSLKVLWMAAAQPPLLCPGSQLGNFDQPVATMFTMQRWKVPKKANMWCEFFLSRERPL